jgi:methyl-CpG-binding domain protein 4
LEEILWSDEWKLLVACMMLNCTTRLQVDRVLWRLFLLVPTPEDAIRLGADEGSGDGFGTEGGAGEKSGSDRIEEILRPLGLHRKRARALVKLSEDYVSAKGAAALPEGRPGGAEGGVIEGGVIGGAPNNSSRLRVPVASLHGVGAYASDAHAMFCEGLLGVAPRDHALRWWYAWALERRESERRTRRAAAQAAR